MKGNVNAFRETNILPSGACNANGSITSASVAFTFSDSSMTVYSSTTSSADIPDFVEDSSDYWFSWIYKTCSKNAKTLALVRISAVGNWAFQDFAKLKAVSLGSALQSIGEYSFYGCTSLEGLEIPSTVTSIGVGSFSSCSKLQAVTYLGTTALTNDALQGCSKLVCINVSENYPGTIFGGLDVTSSDYNCSNYHPGQGLSVGAIAGIAVAAVVVVVAVIAGVAVGVRKQSRVAAASPEGHT